MKNMSFGKILVIFGVFFVLLIGGTVFFLTMNGKAKTVTSSRTVNPPAQAIIPVQNATPQVPQQQLLASNTGESNPSQYAPIPRVESASSMTENAQKTAPIATNKSTASVPQNNSDREPTLAEINANITDLTRRIAALEQSEHGQKTSNIKTSSPRTKKSNTNSNTKVAKASTNEVPTNTNNVPTPIPANAGYKVQATVSGRAWIQAGDRVESVAAGDRLPMIEYNQLRVTNVNSENGNVITAHDTNASKYVLKQR